MSAAMAALAAFASITIIAMWRGWLITALVFGIATLVVGCGMAS